MSKHLVFVTLVTCLLASNNSSACDACGCNLGASYFGISPTVSQHFIGYRLSSSRYHGEIHEIHDHDGTIEEHHETSDDSYFRSELIGRWMVSPRIQFGYFIPYQINVRDGHDHRTTLSGFGDPSLIGYVRPIQEDPNSNLKQALLVGIGVKIPIGDYQADTDGELVHPNAQIGTGSFDWIMSANYTIHFKQFGLNTEQSLKLNGKNSLGYQYGNQVTSTAMLFYRIQSGSLAMLPIGGVLFEKAGQHFDQQVVNENSGGQATYLNLGAQVFLNTWGLNVHFQTPLIQNLNTEDGGSITAKNRFSFSFTKSFGKSS